MPGLKLIQTTRTYMESTQADFTKASSQSKHITLIERQQIERWLKEKVPVAEIARRLNRHKSTIYREIQRGLVALVNSDLSVSCIYQWDRTTRFQHIILIKDKTQKSVISAINRLERRLGLEKFHTLFKSITCDNGVEFQNFEGIEKSVFSKTKKRTKVYFAHSYSSYERGSNENANRLIRRFLPKGSTFDKLRQRDVQKLARRMNKNPRKLFAGMSANDKAKEFGLNFKPAKT